MRLKTIVSWSVSLLVMRCDVITMRWRQNGSPWSGQHVNSPSKEKSETQSSVSKVMCIVFGDSKRAIFLDFLEPRQAINSNRYIATLMKMKAPNSRVRTKTIFLLQQSNIGHSASLKTVEQSWLNSHTTSIV